MRETCVFVISGVPGAGKTTVANALARRFARAVVVTGDDLRDAVVTGAVSGLDAWTDEHSRQFAVSWRAVATIAARYADAGFVVVIDDVLDEGALRAHVIPELVGREVHRVFLRPSLETAIARNRARTNKSFDPERLVPIIRRLYDTLSVDSADWLVIDVDRKDAAGVVDDILAEVQKY